MYYVIFGAIVSYAIYYYYYPFSNSDLEIDNSTALITKKDHLPFVKINHVSEGDDNIKEYIKKSLESLYLKVKVNEMKTSDSDESLNSEKSYDIIDENSENSENVEEDELKVPENLKKGHHDKIYVEYSINNENFAICIKSEISKKDPDSEANNHGLSGLKRKVINGYLIKNKEKLEKLESLESLEKSEEDFEEKIEVTKLLKEFQGPEYNFYQNLDGVTNRWEDVLYPYDLKEWDSLIIYDLFGDKTEFRLDNDLTIEWDTFYKL